MNPLDALRHNVTGAIERGEKQAIHEQLSILDGYNKKTMHTVRKLTFQELKTHLENNHEFLCIDNKNLLRRCRKGSSVKTWKRDSYRMECTFKYGMYESVRWNTSEMLDRLVVKV